VLVVQALAGGGWLLVMQTPIAVAAESSAA
jgi:hypothetical protein